MVVNFLEMNSERQYLSFEKESQNRCLVCSRPAQNMKLGIFVVVV